MWRDFPPFLPTSLYLNTIGPTWSSERGQKWGGTALLGGVCWSSLRPRMSFLQEQKSSLSGLWLRRGSVSSLLDMVPGKRGAGLEGMRNVGTVAISMLSVIHPQSPRGPIFGLVCLPRKGQARLSQKLEAHTQPPRQKEWWRDACWFKPVPSTLRGRKSQGFFFPPCLKATAPNWNQGFREC